MEILKYLSRYNVDNPMSVPPMPLKPPKQPKIKRIYEDNDFIIDLLADSMVRVSIFKDNHFVDEVFIRKEDYCE